MTQIGGCTITDALNQALQAVWNHLDPNAQVLSTILRKRSVDKSIQFNMKYGPDYKENLINVQTDTNEEMAAILTDPLFAENLETLGRLRAALESETPKGAGGAEPPKSSSKPPAAKRASKNSDPSAPVCKHGPMRKAWGGEGDKAWVRWYCQGENDEGQQLPKNEQCKSVAG